jgi:hypothetical protein
MLKFHFHALAAVLLAAGLLVLVGCEKRQTSTRDTSFGQSPTYVKGEYQPRKTTSYHMGKTNFYQTGQQKD